MRSGPAGFAEGEAEGLGAALSAAAAGLALASLVSAAVFLLEQEQRNVLLMRTLASKMLVTIWNFLLLLATVTTSSFNSMSCYVYHCQLNLL